MPEGDTIYRAARSLREWLAGRVITRVDSRVEKVPARVLEGRTLEAVESRGKHLLMRFGGDVTLHTHMKMTGSWHVYSAGERWRKPDYDARIVLEAGERVAVCFNAPVVELLDPHLEARHPSLARLGPDVLDDDFDVDEALARARSRPPETLIGELLLDQSVAAGVGNIYRCESLFIEKVDPWLPVAQLDDDRLRRLLLKASQIMKANLPVAAGFGRDFGGGPDRPFVYGRTRRPCFRCRTPIKSARMGSDQPRDLYWCPRCQSSS